MSTGSSLGSATVLSMRDNVSRSSTRRLIRTACCVMRRSDRRVMSGSGSVMSVSVSRNPPSTVSGVRSSCETFATKSRRVVSRRSHFVMSRPSSSFSWSPYDTICTETVASALPPRGMRMVSGFV